MLKAPARAARRDIEPEDGHVRNSIKIACVAALVATAVVVQPVAPARAAAPPSWTLSWSDEFDGPDGSVVDASKWATETGGNGFGNNELEYYTDRAENAHLENGALVITAAKERFTGRDGVTRSYTSARLKTQGKFSQRYGRFEARLKIPFGQGIWPAFWMLGDNVGSAGWPTCGEIDIMENIGREPATVHGTIHGPGYSGGSGIGAPYALANGQRFADDFHVYAIEWEPAAIRWYVDDVLYQTRTPADLPNGAKWVYDHPFFMLLNVAVGGGWPGNPDDATVFPQTMLVDYVRVYTRVGGTIASVTPSSARRGSAVDVRLAGSGFAEGAAVSFGDPKIKVVSVDVVSDSEVAVRIKIKKKAALGARDVTVTNPDGGAGVAAGAFTVQ
jgi:beta-glucanase (GH16 family)